MSKVIIIVGEDGSFEKVLSSDDAIEFKVLNRANAAEAEAAELAEADLEEVVLD